MPPQSLEEIIAEARGSLNLARTPPSELVPRPSTMEELIEEARAKLRASLDSHTTIRPIYAPDPDDEYLVRRAIDGDTVEVDGLGTVRLTGLNTPETVDENRPIERRGMESSQLASVMLTGKKVKFRPSPEGTDSYGRLLGELILPDGRSANASLMEALGRYPGSALDSYGNVTAGAGPEPLRESKAATRSAIGSAVTAGILRGMIYPIGSLVPELYSDLSEEMNLAKQQMHKFMQDPQVFKAMGRPSDTLQSVIAGTPGVVGELIGGAGPGIGMYKVAQKAFGVAQGVNMGEKTLRHLSASAATGAGFGAAAKLEEGESRFARIARDAVIAGATEVVTLPLIRRAWRAELGEKASRAAIAEYARSKGISLEEAERKLTAVRSGAVPADFETHREIIELGKKIPGLRGSPLHMQSARALEMLESVLPADPATVDPNLPESIALAFELVIDGSSQPIRLASRTAATQEEIIGRIDGVVKSIIKERAAGRTVVIRHPMTRNLQSWEYFKNRLLSRGQKRSPTGKPMGAAPPGSVAETGVFPETGDNVNVVGPDGRRFSTQVVDVGSQTPEVPGEGIPFPSFSQVGYGRLVDAGLTPAEIGQLNEVDFHVAAAMATPGRPDRQKDVLAEIRTLLGGKGVCPPT